VRCGAVQSEARRGWANEPPSEVVLKMLSLPLPLVLLVHIHLLGYPHADEPEYDQHVFDAKTRGLRDRTKTMEELSYFLVGKIEHKPRLKSVSLTPYQTVHEPTENRFSSFRPTLARSHQTR
jgi:hypothetical protein